MNIWDLSSQDLQVSGNIKNQSQRNNPSNTKNNILRDSFKKKMNSNNKQPINLSRKPMRTVLEDIFGMVEQLENISK